MKIELSEDEYETLKNIFLDHGFEYSLKTDSYKMLQLAKKLGFEEYLKMYGDDVENNS